MWCISMESLKTIDIFRLNYMSGLLSYSMDQTSHWMGSLLINDVVAPYVLEVADALYT